MKASQDIQIVHVVAIDKQGCIGQDNQLAWHLPEDLKHFKQLTTGGVIVMGRKTFDSLGRLLPKRSHHVITRDKNFYHPDIKVWHSLEQAINEAKLEASQLGLSAIHIIGGGQIYKQSLKLADRLEITLVDLDVQGDAFYPSFEPYFDCQYMSETKTDLQSGISYRFSSWQRAIS